MILDPLSYSPQLDVKDAWQTAKNGVDIALKFAELSATKYALSSFGELVKYSLLTSSSSSTSSPSQFSIFRSVSQSANMGQDPREAWRQLTKMAQRAGAGRGGGPSPKLAGGVGALILLGGVAVVGSNALFNVDGGHRAIKYTRIGGVGKEIYTEGTLPFLAITFFGSNSI